MTSTGNESQATQISNETSTPSSEGNDTPQKSPPPLGDLTLLATDITLNYNVRIAHEQKSRKLFGSSGERGVIQALRGITLAAREGEFIGLVGRNGSGKSTLLRVLAGVETPSTGQVIATSTPQLMGVKAALMPYLTGVDNIRIGLLAMGLSPEEVEERIEQVANLADIGTAIRMPMRTYSSGMNARLRFAISVAAQPDILMIDEALSTGDDAFRQRSNEAMKELIARSGTGFLVNHSASAIRELCTRVIWLDKGEVIMDGETYFVVQKYSNFMNALRRHGESTALSLLAKYRQSFGERVENVGEEHQVTE